MKQNKIKQIIKKYSSMGFSETFCREEYFVEEFRQLFPGYKFSHNDLPKILAYFTNIGKIDEMKRIWNETLQLYNKTAAVKEIEKQKNKKVRELNRDMAYSIISSGMKERGLPYAIELYEYRMVVYISILNRWQAEFSIPYSNFDIESCSLFDNVDKLIGIQKSNTPMNKLQRKNRNIKWEN